MCSFLHILKLTNKNSSLLSRKILVQKEEGDSEKSYDPHVGVGRVKNSKNPPCVIFKWYLRRSTSISLEQKNGSDSEDLCTSHIPCVHRLTMVSIPRGTLKYFQRSHCLFLSITRHKHISLIRLPRSNRQRDRALWSRLGIFTPLHELKQASTWATYSYYKVEMWSNCRATRSTSSWPRRRLPWITRSVAHRANILLRYERWQ